MITSKLWKKFSLINNFFTNQNQLYQKAQIIQLLVFQKNQTIVIRTTNKEKDNKVFEQEQTKNIYANSLKR